MSIKILPLGLLVFSSSSFAMLCETGNFSTTNKLCEVGSGPASCPTLPPDIVLPPDVIHPPNPWPDPWPGPICVSCPEPGGPIGPGPIGPIGPVGPMALASVSQFAPSELVSFSAGVQVSEEKTSGSFREARTFSAPAEVEYQFVNEIDASQIRVDGSQLQIGGCSCPDGGLLNAATNTCVGYYTSSLYAERLLYPSSSNGMASEIVGPYELRSDLAAFGYLGSLYEGGTSPKLSFEKLNDSTYANILSKNDYNRINEAKRTLKSWLTILPGSSAPIFLGSDVNTAAADLLKVKDQLLNVYYFTAASEQLKATYWLNKVHTIPYESVSLKEEYTFLSNAKDILTQSLNEYWSLIDTHSSVFVDRVPHSAGNYYNLQRNNNADNLVLVFEVMAKLAEVENKLAKNAIKANASFFEKEQLKTQADQLYRNLQGKSDQIKRLLGSKFSTIHNGNYLLQNAEAELVKSLESLDTLRHLNSDDYVIYGIEGDFVPFNQYGYQGNQEFDTFTEIKAFLDSPSGLIQQAVRKSAEAKTALQNKIVSQESLSNSIRQETQNYRTQLMQLVGDLNCQKSSCEITPSSASSGSIIDTQRNFIASKVQQLELAEIRFYNLKQNIEIEIKKEIQLNDWVQAHVDIIEDNGVQQTDYMEELKDIAINNIPENSPLSKTELTEQLDIEIQKEQLVVSERTEILLKEKQRNEIERSTSVARMNLELRALKLDIDIEKVSLVMENNRMQALLATANYYKDLIAARSINDYSLYFNNPAYGLDIRSKVQLADRYMWDAQSWLVYAINVLEYKWNEPFISRSGKTKRDVLSISNATELEAFYAQVVNYDVFKSNQSGNKALKNSVLSLKEDIWGFVPEFDKYGYEVFRYEDQYGNLISADNAFRLKLESSRHASVPSYISIPFSTVKPVPSEMLFVGPRVITEQNGQQCIVDGGTYDNKLHSIGIDVVNYSQTASGNSIHAYLTYGGNSFLRPKNPSLTGGLKVVSAKFWEGTFDKLAFENQYRENMTARINNFVQLAPTYAFAERSVAASNWRLSLQIGEENSSSYISTQDIDDIQLHIVHSYRSTNYSDCNNGPLITPLSLGLR